MFNRVTETFATLFFIDFKLKDCFIPFCPELIRLHENILKNQPCLGALEVPKLFTHRNFSKGRIQGTRRGRMPPSWIRPPHLPKSSPMVLFYDIHCRPKNTKIFLTAPLAPIYTFLRGARRKNAIFWSHFSRSAQKRLFLSVFSTTSLWSK